MMVGMGDDAPGVVAIAGRSGAHPGPKSARSFSLSLAKAGAAARIVIAIAIVATTTVKDSQRNLSLVAGGVVFRARCISFSFLVACV
jgi:hypothetical protein